METNIGLSYKYKAMLHIYTTGTINNLSTIVEAPTMYVAAKGV